MKRNEKSPIAAVVMFLVFLIPVAVFSQVPSNWTILPGDTEHALIDVASFNSDTLFTLDEAGNIFASFDGGNTWKERNPQTGKELKFNSLRINSNLQTIIAVGDDDAIYRSTNMGENWEQTYYGSVDATGTVTPVSLKAISDDGENYNASLVYVVGQKGTVLKSINDGLNWEKKELNIGANQDLKFVTFMNPDTGFVANENGIIRTFDGGKSWKVLLTDSGSKGLQSNKRTADLKKLADELVNLTINPAGGIQTSTDYGTTWSDDVFETPCDLLASGGTIFNPDQCEDLQNGLLVYGGGGAGKARSIYMLSGNTFKGILQPKWENVTVEGIVMVMQTSDEQTVIAETVTDSKGRFDLDIPASFSGDVNIAPLQVEPDPGYCYRPLPHDFGDVVLEPMEECDESTLPLRIINPIPVALNNITVSENNWLAVGNRGVVLTRTIEDSDGDGYADARFWSKQNSRTNEDLLAATARGIEKSDIRRGFIATGNAGTIVSTKNPSFEMVSPTENDSLCTDTEITIKWAGGEASWNVLVYVIDVNSWAVASVVNSNTLNDGNEIWTIPSNLPAGFYQIYVQELNYATWAYGDTFKIVHCPTDPVCLEECTNNLLRNWNFNENPVFGPMPQGSVSDWTRWPNTKSPDVSSINCSSNDTVSIGMWGNGINGESIFQTLTTPFQSGQTYSISFMAMWRDIPGRPYPLQFEFRANNANLSSYEIIGVSNPILTKENWVVMSLPDWKYTGSTIAPYSVISVRPINHSFSAHYDSTSYGLIGAICITEARLTGNLEIPSHSGGFELGESYPNPFSETTVIKYSLPYAEKVTIQVFDLNGREIKTLIDKVLNPGDHQIEWDATGLPGGIYLYRMQAGNFMDTKRTVFRD